MKRIFYSFLLLAPLLGACSHSVTRPLSSDRELAAPQRAMATSDTATHSQVAELR